MCPLLESEFQPEPELDPQPRQPQPESEFGPEPEPQLQPELGLEPELQIQPELDHPVLDIQNMGTPEADTVPNSPCSSPYYNGRLSTALSLENATWTPKKRQNISLSSDEEIFYD